MYVFQIGIYFPVLHFGLATSLMTLGKSYYSKLPIGTLSWPQTRFHTSLRYVVCLMVAVYMHWYNLLWTNDNIFLGVLTSLNPICYTRWAEHITFVQYTSRCYIKFLRGTFIVGFRLWFWDFVGLREVSHIWIKECILYIWYMYTHTHIFEYVMLYYQIYFVKKQWLTV